MESETTKTTAVVKNWLDKGFRYAYTYRKSETLLEALAKRNVAKSSQRAICLASTYLMNSCDKEEKQVTVWDLQTEYDKVALG
jgi:hypothetical protein